MKQQWTLYLLIALGVTIASMGMFALLLAYTIVIRSAKILAEVQEILARATVSPAPQSPEALCEPEPEPRPGSSE